MHITYICRIRRDELSKILPLIEIGEMKILFIHPKIQPLIKLSMKIPIIGKYIFKLFYRVNKLIMAETVILTLKIIK